LYLARLGVGEVRAEILLGVLGARAHGCLPRNCARGAASRRPGPKVHTYQDGALPALTETARPAFLNRQG